MEVRSNFCHKNKNMNLKDFYPRYPNIHKDEDTLFNLYPDETFRDIIVSKKEFSDLKLPTVEHLPEKPGEYFNHQKVIMRFLATNTPYDEILLSHEMGTGKTCTAVACIENIRYEQDSFKGALIFARGDGLLKNFVNELLYKCTDGRYIPENLDSLTEMQKVRRIGKVVNSYYMLSTFEKFAKHLEELTDDKIRQDYSNNIIVIDEVHNIRLKEDKTEEQLNVYNQFHRFLHLIENRKIILMSGTPIKDQLSEIAHVMNLILPLDKQFGTNSFVKEYFHGSHFKPDKREEFIQRVSGRISFLKAMTSKVKKDYMGQIMGPLKHFKVWPTKMSSFQSDIYMEAYKRDKKDRTLANYSRQASLFVFPNGSYGIEGSNKYIDQKFFTSMKGTKKRRYVMGLELAGEIGKNIDNLRKFSCKYADLLENILTNPREKVFIYCEFVDGSGAILLGLILKHFGYIQATGRETTKALRYVIVTNKTSSPREIRRIIDQYNSHRNKDGEIVSIIIGSKVIAEGYTLKSVSKEVILTPHWNYSETSQVIARGWRVGSHSMSPDISHIEIYHMVSFPTDSGDQSIDLEMYELSERKDIQIKEVEHAIKISAFDCWLNKDRNMIKGYDGMRECDYTDCKYTCVGQPLDDVDISTYNLYYSRHARLLQHLTNFFKKNYSLTLKELLEKFPEYTLFEIMKTIRSLTEKDVTVNDRYNIPQYIRMDKTTVFLSPDPSRTYDYLTSFYSRNVIVDTNIDYSDIVADKMRNDAPNKITNIFKYPEYVNNVIPSLEHKVQIVLLQGSIQAEDRRLQKNVPARKAILAYFRGSYMEDKSNWVINMISPNLCLTKGTDIWKECKTPEKYVHNKLRDSPIGYYGTYNPRLENMFCLRDVQDIDNKDLRRINVGKRCLNFSKEKLTDIIARRIKKDPPSNFLQNKTRTELEDMGRKITGIISQDFEGSDDDLRRVIYWGKQLMGNICTHIRHWMEENDLLTEDLNCGHQQKRRFRAINN